MLLKGLVGSVHLFIYLFSLFSLVGFNGKVKHTIEKSGRNDNVCMYLCLYVLQTLIQN